MCDQTKIGYLWIKSTALSLARGVEPTRLSLLITASPWFATNEAPAGHHWKPVPSGLRPKAATYSVSSATASGELRLPAR